MLLRAGGWDLGLGRCRAATWACRRACCRSAAAAAAGSRSSTCPRPAWWVLPVPGGPAPAAACSLLPDCGHDLGPGPAGKHPESINQGVHALAAQITRSAWPVNCCLTLFLTGAGWAVRLPLLLQDGPALSGLSSFGMPPPPQPDGAAAAAAAARQQLQQRQQLAAAAAQRDGAAAQVAQQLQQGRPGAAGGGVPGVPGVIALSLSFCCEPSGAATHRKLCERPSAPCFGGAWECKLNEPAASPARLWGRTAAPRRLTRSLPCTRRAGRRGRQGLAVAGAECLDGL